MPRKWEELKTPRFAKFVFRRSFIQYLAVGGICALLDWSAFYCLSIWFDVAYIPSALLAFCIATGVNSVLSRLVFVSKGRSRFREVLLIYFVSGMAMCLDIAIMMLCIQWLSILPIISKMIGTGCAFFLNYGARQFWIFRKEDGG